MKVSGHSEGEGGGGRQLNISERGLGRGGEDKAKANQKTLCQDYGYF